MARKDPNAVNVAHMLRKGESRVEPQSNGSGVPHNITDFPDQVRENYSLSNHGTSVVWKNLEKAMKLWAIYIYIYIKSFICF